MKWGRGGHNIYKSWLGIGWLVAVVLASPQIVGASAGGAGAEFLKMGAGARGTAMGDSQVAIPEGPLSTFWNPAGLGGVSSVEVSLSHNQWVEDVKDQRLAVSVPFKTAGTLGLGYQRLAVEDFLGFDAQGTRTKDVSSSDDVFSLGWGKNLVTEGAGGGGVMAGVVAKAISEEVAGVRGSGIAADLGMLFRPWGATAQRHGWMRRLSLGAAIRHLGSGVKMGDEISSLPTEYVTGFGYVQPMAGDLLTVSSDLHQVTGEGLSLGGGVEYWLKNVMALRAGYRTTQTDGAGVRAGAGFRLGAVQVDYAWSALGKDLGNGHRITLGYRWGASAPAPGISADIFNDLVARGRRRMELGLYDQAILDFSEALRIKPNDEDVQKWLLECGKKMEGSDAR